MRLPLFSIIGLASLALIGVIVWLSAVVSNFAGVEWIGPAWLISSVVTGGRSIGLVIVAAALALNQRLPLLVAWIVAAVNVVASLISLVTFAANDAFGNGLADVLWMLGFAAAGVMALLLWIRSGSKPSSSSDPWAQPQQAYANAVQQQGGWGQQASAPRAPQQGGWGQQSAAAPQERVSNPTQPVQPYPPQQSQPGQQG